jgi:Calx-beta domain
MTNRSKPPGTGASGRRPRPGRKAGALAAVLIAGMLGAGHGRADSIVLKSGEVIEGSVIEATRNTVIVLRSIGGMRQMPIEDIEEVRVDLARGQPIVGQLLGWADGVYEVRSGDEIVRVGESGVLSREPSQQTAQLLPTRPRGAQRSTAAAAPSTAPAEQRAEPAAPAGPAEPDRTRAAAAPESDDAAAAADAERQERETAAQTAAERQSQPDDTGARAAATRESLAAAARQRQANETEAQVAASRESQAGVAGQSPARETASQAAAEAEDDAAAERPRQPVADPQTPAEPAPETQAAAQAQAPAEPEPETQAAAEAQAATDRQSQAAAGEQQAALGVQGVLAVKASVDPPASGARDMVFNIELSEPAKQTVVLIYGTVDGTAKAGEDYEAQQGMVTLAPGARTAEVRVPLIEGAPEDGDKRFELVLMADPKVAEVVDRRVIATIKGAD